jgi:phosphatidylethanolamine/phosphatidyl-N-methylethanolamine N-methyltransferase
MMRDNIEFLKVALKNMKTTGSITGSSKFLVQDMLEKVDFQRAGIIVEFGAGNGSLTTKILENLNSDAQLLSFELNEDFYEQLKATTTDPRLRIIHDDVAKLDRYVANGSVDVIISALPLLNMPEEVKRSILTAAKAALKPGGRFLQYQYSLNDLKLIKEYFGAVHLDFTLFNIPPAFIYSAV